MENQMVVGAIVMTYLVVAIIGVYMLTRRKPVSKKPLATIVASAKDFAATTLKMAAWTAAEAGKNHTKIAS